jgi:hypothetical protein
MARGFRAVFHSPPTPHPQGERGTVRAFTHRFSLPFKGKQTPVGFADTPANPRRLWLPPSKPPSALAAPPLERGQGCKARTRRGQGWDALREAGCLPYGKGIVDGGVGAAICRPFLPLQKRVWAMSTLIVVIASEVKQSREVAFRGDSET